MAGEIRGVVCKFESPDSEFAKMGNGFEKAGDKLRRGAEKPAADVGKIWRSDRKPAAIGGESIPDRIGCLKVGRESAGRREDSPGENHEAARACPEFENSTVRARAGPLRFARMRNGVSRFAERSFRSAMPKLASGNGLPFTAVLTTCGAARFHHVIVHVPEEVERF